MKGEIICVGTELLLGDIVNTNAQFLSTELAKLGINVYNQSVVGDNAERIKQVLSSALTRSDVLIFTGGLGPTEDDLTKEAIASYLGLPLVENGESRSRIEQYFRRTGREMSESNYKQALAPESSRVLQNDVGTAPGFMIEKDGKIIIILPGPPKEMQHMFNKSVKPLLSLKSDCTIASHTIHVFGEMESAIEGKIKDFIEKENPTTAPYAKDGEIALRVTAKAENKAAADRLCAPVINSIKEILSSSVYGVDSKGLNYTVVEMLKEKNLKIATAESCTAGILSAMITEVAGSSQVFDFGISAYANHIKTNALGVPQSIIEKHGAVSEYTASYMALGVKKLSGADIGIGITGVAGPSASENKPVGLVYIALADKHNIWVRRVMLGHGKGEREKVRINYAKTALDLVRRYISSLPEVMPGGFEIGQAPVVLNSQPAIAGENNIRTESLNIPFFFENNDLAYSFEEQYSDDFEQVSYPTSEEDLLLNLKTSSRLIGKILSIKFKAFVLFLRRITTPIKDTYIDTKEKVKPRVDKFMNTKFAKKTASVLKSFLPWKGDTFRSAISKCIFTVSLAALIISSVYMVSYFYEGTEQGQVNTEIRDIYNKTNFVKNDEGRYESFDTLLEQNSDTIAWLSVPNCNVDNPVVLGEDNDFYLNHNFLKESSRYGTLFLDCSAKVSAEKTSQNLVVHGHKMRDGSMFGSLDNYKNINFYKENPVFSLKTLYDNSQYKIFAVAITNASKEDDNGYVFNYMRPDFDTKEQFLGWINDVKERSIINTGVDIEEDDMIVTLSTCTYEFDDARLVIFARKVRSGESKKIDTSLVSVNQNTRYPQAYYDKKGIQNPYRYVSSNNISITQSTVSYSSSENSYNNSYSSQYSYGEGYTYYDTNSYGSSNTFYQRDPSGYQSFVSSNPPTSVTSQN